MPRIDPERLLKTLAPLLEPASGAIKSDKEVDKIYGLMSKFSKKLVSKCTYINILKASQLPVLDLFLQRGGWDMVLGWTADATNKKNYDLLKEIVGLLLYAPASIDRLKENELPKIMKSLSKDCENEEIREIAKNVVSRWISIAKQQEIPSSMNSLPLTLAQNVVQSCSITSSNSSVPQTVGGSNETETPASAEFDISTFEINEMIDFNPEDFSKAVDQHLGEIPTEALISNATDGGSCNIAAQGLNATTPNVALPKTPKLLIKTVDGQAMVQNLDSSVIASADSTKSNESPFCIVMKDGKPFLVRLKLASPQEVTKLGFQATNEIAKGSNGDGSQDKVRRPRKDPHLSTKTSEEGNQASTGGVKTYSKKIPVEPIKNSTAESSKSKSSKSGKSSSDTAKKSRSSSSKASAVAAAAKKQEEEDKLKEKIKQEKIMVKKRVKEAAKQKQVEKDQETLKKLNLVKSSSTNSSPNSMKIPKIPKKQASFADALGITGAGPDVPVAVSGQDKTPKKNSSKDDVHISIEKSAKKEVKDEAAMDDSNNKTRRHRVKVFTSKKSRADELLRDMTENVKSNKSNKSDSGKASDSVISDKSLSSFGNSLIAKSEKRPSIDGIEKPGDPKKQKLDDNDKKKDSSSKTTSSKDKDKKGANVIKESSLFMDALTASSETKPSVKRKRRLSSSAEKEKDIPVAARNNSKDKLQLEVTSPVSAPIKPVFNFYRETLDENETETKNADSSFGKTSPQADGDDRMDITEIDKDEDELPSDFGSHENEPLKGVLVIHRPKNKQRKSVRWREEEELKEVFTFELDEDERCNVSRPKDFSFSAMMEHEKAEEKEYLVKNLKRRILGEEDVEDRMPWRRPSVLLLDNEFPPIISTEKATQEERERLTLGLFLPPGSTLPDTPNEPDPQSPREDEEPIEPKIIPMDDVMNVTKVYDRRNEAWPLPKPEHPSIGRMSRGPISPNQSNFGVPHFGMHGPHSAAAQLMQGFPASSNSIDFSNPWNLGPTAKPPPVGLPPGMGDMSSFQGIRVPPPMGFSVPPPNMINSPFGFPVPNFPPPPSMGFPPATRPIISNNLPRDVNQSGTAVRGGSGRDFADRDHRRSFRDSREGSDTRRDGYDSRGRSRGSDYRSRDYDRDRRSPSPTRRRRDERDRDRYSRDEKDFRDNDYRSRGRSGGKKEIQCRFFRRGHCHSGSRCEFSHGESNEKTDKTRNEYESSKDGGHNSPLEDNQSGSSFSTNTSSDALFERRPSKDSDTTNFTENPSSPTNEIAEDPSILFTASSEPAKIIPV